MPADPGCHLGKSIPRRENQEGKGEGQDKASRHLTQGPSAGPCRGRRSSLQVEEPVQPLFQKIFLREPGHDPGAGKIVSPYFNQGRSQGVRRRRKGKIMRVGNEFQVSPYHVEQPGSLGNKKEKPGEKADQHPAQWIPPLRVTLFVPKNRFDLLVAERIEEVGGNIYVRGEKPGRAGKAQPGREKEDSVGLQAAFF